MIGFFLNFI